MSYVNGPLTVTNGLVMCLDAGNANSYPGTGTTWIDVSNNGNNGTLLGSPVFNTNYFSLSGNTVGPYYPYISTPYVAASPYTQPITYDVWFLNNNSPAYAGIIGASSWQTNGFSVGFSSNSQLKLTYSTAGSGYQVNFNYDSTTITHGVFVLSGYNFYAYRNSVLVSTLTAPFSSTPSSQTVGIGYIYQGGWTSAKINIYSAKIYNRALSQTEIYQNFNALRGRFGV